MITEMSLGRKTGKNPVLAYDTIHPHARIVGCFGVLAAFVILSYYAIIGGWIIKYFASYATTFQPRPISVRLRRSLWNRWSGFSYSC